METEEERPQMEVLKRKSNIAETKRRVSRRTERLMLSSALEWSRTEQPHLNDIARVISQKKGRGFRSEWEEGNKTLSSSSSLKRKREGREGVT